jgi:hypothetical protein
MKWGTRIGRIQKSIDGTARAHLYYWIRRDDAHNWKAGRYWFNQEVEYQGKVFRTPAQARAYCERMDREAIIIEAVTA